MKIKDSVIEKVNKELSRVRVDVDIEFCKQNNIKYDNDEVNASTVDLFNKKSNKAAFDFLTKKH